MKYSPMDEWIKKKYIYMVYTHSLKKKRILLYASTWMNLKDIILSEISQSQKDKYCMLILR